MIRSLLNKLNTPKALRQALVLFTLLLLPTTAWGQTKITVAGVAKTETGAITGTGISGTVSYNADNKTLTLTDATITGNIIWKPEANTDKLTIKINGTCKVESSGAVCIENNLENSTPSTALSIEKDNSSTEKASLYLSANAPNTYSIQGFSSLSYNGFNTYSSNEGNSPYSALTVTYTASGLTWESGLESGPVVSVSFQESYNLWIGDTQVARFNKDDVLNDGGSVKFTPADNTASPATPATLTLDGATISGGIYTSLKDLTIDITNTNSISTSVNGIVSSDNSGKLTFTGAGSLEISSGYSVIRGFTAIEGLNLATETPYEIDDYYRLKDKVAADTTSVKWLKVIQETTYPLWVSNVQVTEANKENVTGRENKINDQFTVVYDGNGLLLLAHTTNNENITGIYSGIGDLSIKLIGDNTIKGSGSSLITSLNSGALTFDSDGTTISLLEFKDASGNVFPNDPISGFSEVKYGTWLEYDDYFKKVCWWDIEIIKNGTSYRIYDSNKNDILSDGGSVKYSHDVTNGHVITLNNAEVNCIWTDIHADITIALSGTNSAINTEGTYAIYSNNGYINIVKAEGATSAELEAQAGSNIAISSFTVGSGLYEKPISTIHTIITDNPQFVIVGDRVITNGQTISGIQGSISYSESEGEKVLTLTNYVETFGSGHGNMNAIETGVIGLKVKLVGDNYISCEDNGAYAFKGTHDNASIQFIKEGSDSKLTMTTSSSNPLSFGSGKVTYDGLIFLPDADKKYICEPTAPTMSLDNGKVKLTKDYDDGTIYYSIAYADDTPSETGVKYTEPFAITHPGVVTAWVEANNATTSTVTGKHFAYQDAPYTMAINGTKTPTLLPAIAEGDVISLSGYASADGDIASFIDGLITAKKPGTVTLSAILTPGDNTPFKVLNPVSDPNAPNEHTVSFSVYVGENLSNYFEGSNEFGTFYNEDSEIYAVPQGMKAYVVTGVSGSKLVTVETTVLPPNTVVLLDKAEGISFIKVPSEGAAPGGNLLKHATAEVSVTTESSLYVLYNDTYVKATAGSPIPTGKNYLDLSASTNAGTRGFYTIGDGEGTTAISEVKSGEVKGEKWDDAWFDLQGRRLPAQPVKPGLYIHKDKKVVIK